MLLVGTTIAACTPEHDRPALLPAVFVPLSPPEFAVHTDRFEAAPSGDDVFDVVSADAELDGDPDLFVNRHMLGPWELLENQGDGTFVQRNVRGDDPSGLYDNPGVPTLYADEAAMLERIAEAGPAITVWHDTEPGTGWWHLDVPAALAPITLTLEVSLPFEAFEGTELGDLLVNSGTLATLSLDGPRQLRFRNELIGTSLRVDTAPAAALQVGPDLAPFTGEVVLWKGDPHGLAWVDAVGSPEPDLFVCRGALTGRLVAPMIPKADQLFEWVGDATTYASVPITPGYGRGRQVAWADLDADGVDELYLSDTDTADQVLDPDGAGGFVDRAAEWGLELEADDTFAVLDVDDDGLLDLVSGSGRTLRVLFRRGPRFEETPGADLGLAWPEGFTTSADGLFNPLGLQLVDFDRDGDLDLIAADDEEVRIFRRTGTSFADVGAVGLPVPVGSPTLVPFDADLDGDIDVVVASDELWIGVNDGTGRFEARRIDEGWAVAPDRATLAADADGDGLEDLLMVSRDDRLLVHNVSPGVRDALRLHPEVPRGTRIVAVVEDGALLAMQWGANAVGRYSQGTQPILVGSPRGRRIEALRIRRPGEVDEQVIAVPRGARELVIR